MKDSLIEALKHYNATAHECLSMIHVDDNYYYLPPSVEEVCVIKDSEVADRIRSYMDSGMEIRIIEGVNELGKSDVPDYKRIEEEILFDY